MPLNPKLHTTPLRFFFAVNRPEIKILILNTIFYSAGALVLLAAAYYLGETIDALTFNTDASMSVILLLFAIIFHEVFYRIGHVCEVILLTRVRNKTKKALFDHTTSLSFRYFTDRFAGELAHRIDKTADAYERMIVVLTNGFIEGGLLFLASAIVLSFVHSFYALFIVFWSVSFVLISFFLAKRMNILSGIYATEEARTTGAIVDVYGNIGTVKVYGKGEDRARTHNQIDSETKAFRRLGTWDILTFNFQGISMIVLCGGLIWITASLYSSHLITIGGIVFVATMATRFFSVIWEMGKNISSFTRFRGECIKNLHDLIVTPEVLDGAHVTARQKEVKVEYKNVVFGYNNRKPILDHFSVQITPKEKVGIVGLSGSGKTTFANLLLRFFDPQEGEILLNDLNIRNLSQESLRSHISFISQDTSLFHATVAENIAYGSSGVSREEIIKAANLAYAHEFIEELPRGYDSVVGERGVKLSGGQRQRIAIARALLADRPLFLLDEATSALDSDSEAKIQKGLATLMENKTVIAIAHRLFTLSHLDRIIFLEDGKIVEDGTHNELLALNGKYAKLWHMQAGGFLPTVL